MLTEPSILSEFETIDGFLVSCENCQHTKNSTLHNPRWPELILLFTISWGIIIIVIIKKRDPDYTLKEKWFRGDRNLGPPLFSLYCSLLSDPIFLCVSVFSHIFFCQIHLVSHSVNYGSYEKNVSITRLPPYITLPIALSFRGSVKWKFSNLTQLILDLPRHREPERIMWGEGKGKEPNETNFFCLLFSFILHTKSSLSFFESCLRRL